MRKGEEAEEVFRFVAFWKRTHGQWPRHLVFDSKLTTQQGLARLDQMNIPFITLRRRSRKLLEQVYGLPPSAWRTVELDVPTRKYRTPRVYEQTIALAGRSFRQMFIQDLGHEDPTILITNQRHTPAKALVTRYAQRMLIENALSDAVRFFHIDALSSAVGLKVDFDMALLVLASGLYRLVAQRMRGYGDAQARQIFRDLIDMPADVEVSDKEVTVSFHRRAHLPIILASNLVEKPVAVPWWNGSALAPDNLQRPHQTAQTLGEFCSVEIQASKNTRPGEIAKNGGMPWTCTTHPFPGAHCLANRPGPLVRLTFPIGRRGETCTPKAVRS